MKMFTDCSGECCICACGDACLAGHGDDDYSLASKEQIIKRLDNGNFPSYRETMINTLKYVYDYKYQDKNKALVKNKYTLRIPLTMSKEPNEDLLLGFLMKAFASYARATNDELSVYEMALEIE